MSYPHLSILIPAAGASQRLGQAKQLVRHGTGTLIQNIVNTANAINPLEVIVVTGANARAVTEDIKHLPVKCVHNPDWSAGMGGSIATGAKAINPRSRAVMILLCDLWRLQPPDLQLLTATWQLTPDRIVCARAAGQNMPPVIFPGSFLDQLRMLEGQKGARSLLREYAALLTPVKLENAQFDLDTQSQLKQIDSDNLS